MSHNAKYEGEYPLTFASSKNAKVDRVVFVTGKHYYALARHAEESGLSNVAFVRLEQLCPFPTKELQEAVAPFKRAKSEFQVDERVYFLSSNHLNVSIPQNSCGARRSTATWALGSLSSRVSGTKFRHLVISPSVCVPCCLKNLNER